MFMLEGKLTFSNIDQCYLKKLHDACSEVYYKSNRYVRKPYIGILIKMIKNTVFPYHLPKQSIRHGKILIMSDI